jgi:hypothetical protein
MDRYSHINPTTVADVCYRVEELVSLGTSYKNDQRRIRDIMDGGSAGLRALVGRTGERDVDLLDSLPAGNPLLSGLTHLSMKLQHVPDLRVTPAKETQIAREAAETRQRVLWNLDDACRLKLQMPQVGLWLPGYGFAAWILTTRIDADGQPYPHLELRDPMETYPGDWGVDQRPVDCAFIRHAPLKALIQAYPQHTKALLQVGDQGTLPPGGDSSNWSMRSQGVRIAEYYDHRGTWWVIPERKLLLEYSENLLSRPAFVLPKRFAFNKLQGQYDQTIGLMALTARLTVMQAQFIQDNVHGETNIFGQAPTEYHKGRFAFNEFDQGTRVEKVVNNMPFQAFQAIDRLERQLRTTARYPVTDDAQSPAAWATGAGIEELGTSMGLEIREYQTVLQCTLEDLDSMRLEWIDKFHGDTKLSLVGERKGQRYAETYQPSTAIAGNYQTRRNYGVMAGWDESRKLVGGLQLVAAGIIPKATMRENMDGLDESLLNIEEQLVAERAEAVLQDTLLQMAQAGDPRAIGTVIDMLPAGDMKSILTKHFMPEPDQTEPAPPEAALPEQPPGLDELFSNPQILARMSQEGSPNGGGVQVMQEMAR